MPRDRTGWVPGGTGQGCVSLGTGQVGRAWGQLEHGERAAGVVARTVATRLKKTQFCL